MVMAKTRIVDNITHAVSPVFIRHLLTRNFPVKDNPGNIKEHARGIYRWLRQ
jgi:hypothetical protein